MVVQSLDMKKYHFRPQDDNKELLSPELPYLSVIRTLMYLPNSIRPDISFSIC